MFHANAAFDEAYKNYEKLLKERKDKPDDLEWLRGVFLSYAKLRAEEKGDPLAKKWVNENLKPEVFAMGSCLNTELKKENEAVEDQTYVFETYSDKKYDSIFDKDDEGDNDYLSPSKGGYVEDDIAYDAFGYEINLDKRFEETIARLPAPEYNEEGYLAVCTELESLIGLKATKKKIKEIHAFAKVQNMMKEREMETTLPVFHSIFAGPPGTGKTTVARLYGKLLKAAGILGKGHVIEVSRQELVGVYINDEHYKTKKAVTDAIDGVLFIDEAHDLYNANDIWDYGHRSLGTLLKLMEDHRDRFVVIFAGYEEPIRKTLMQFDGFESRVPHTIPFDDFTPEEMADIFLLYCREQGRKIDKALKEDLIKGIKNINRKTNKKMNAREMRNIYDQTLVNHALRIAEMDEISDDDLITIKKEDLGLPIGGGKDNITYLNR